MFVLDTNVVSDCKQSAYAYGKIVKLRKTVGLSTDREDLYIAAIAKVHNATVITRNTKDFERCGVPLFNPFTL